MRNEDRFVWVSALADPKQQPALVRTIIRKHVMRDIGKSRRKSRRNDALEAQGQSAACLAATKPTTVFLVSTEAVSHRDMVLWLFRSLSNDNTREPLVCRSKFDHSPCS